MIYYKHSKERHLLNLRKNEARKMKKRPRHLKSDDKLTTVQKVQLITALINLLVAIIKLLKD